MIKNLDLLVLKKLKKPMTARELSEKLKENYRKINYSLNFLFSSGLIEKKGIKKTVSKKVPAVLWAKKK